MMGEKRGELAAGAGAAGAHGEKHGAAAATPSATDASDQRLVVHYPCKYVPAELLAGFGAACEPVTFESDGFEAANELAHPNLCGFGKSLLSFALRPDVHAIVLTTCCDVMRRVYDVLEREQAVDFLWLVDLPHVRGPREERRLRAELARLAEAFSAWSGRAFDLDRALAAFEPSVPRTDERVSLVGAHAPLSLLSTCAEEMSLPVENSSCTGARQVASPPASLARAPHEVGCDACFSGGAGGGGDDAPRAVAPGAGGGGDDAPRAVAPGDLDCFLDWYAGALLNQTPCMRMADASQREALIGPRGQRGVIYHTMKFCDFYGFEYADVSQDSEVPMLKIETDGTKQSAGQLRTRIKAFDETLGLARVGAADGHKVGPGVAPGGAGASRQPDGPIYVLGVDSGSTSTDAVVMDAQANVVASVIVPTGAKASAGAQRAIDEVLERAGLAARDLALRVATGYGRDAIAGMDASITEITCHARGAHHLAPEAKTIIDIGGQDSKVIHLDEAGGVVNFVMNDKCAAGTGRFLEAMARALQMPLEEFCRAGLEWKHDVKISSMCTVFAESEVVTLVADDTPIADIVHGLCMSVASKTAALAKRVDAEPGYLMTGGVAKNVGVVRTLESVLGAPVATHEDSQLCGAIGAALLGLDSLAR